MEQPHIPLFTDSPRWRASFAFQLNRLGSYLLDVIYPPLCVSCQRVGTLFCIHCQQRIKPTLQTIPPLLDSHIHGFAALGQHTDTLRMALHALKYNGVKQVGYGLGNLLAQTIHEKNWPLDFIIPVPLHTQRLRERGYNQANIIAHGVGNALHIPVASEGLMKIKNTTSQVHLTATERYFNVQDAIRLAPTYTKAFQGRSLLLIDDVCTTGATLNACIEALQTTSPVAIYAATISRARVVDLSSLADDAILIS